MNKDQLRREIRLQRNALNPQWRETASHRIAERLLEVEEVATAEVIHCYVAWRSEVATRGLIERLLRSKKQVVAPRVDILHHTLENYYIQDLSALKNGQFGIPEPDPTLCEAAPTDRLQCIIVPGVAFDRRGNRLGSGHGYYDRFLARCTGLRVGLAFGMQIRGTIPAESHDVKMNLVVTEDETIACGVG